MTPALRAKFAAYCKMTCLGGSERGECPCSGPTDCELQHHPLYPEARRAASARMARWVASEFGAAIAAVRGR